MAISGINTLSTLYDTKKIKENLTTVTTDTTINPTTETSSVSFPVSGANNTSALAQDVLQTLQNFGLDTSSITPDKNNIIQHFVSSLYHSLLAINGDNGASNNDPVLNSVNTTTTNPVITTSTNSDTLNITPTDSNIISGGTNFKYTIDLNQANLGDAQSGVVEDLKKALDNIGQYISSNITFNVKVLGQNMDPGILAEADATMTESTVQSKKLIDTSFVSDATYKSELNPNNPDTNLFINLSRITDMSFDGAPAPDKFDFTSILTHEILHGLAFTGTLGNVSTDLKSQYDKFVTMQDGTPYFTGANAQNANGGNPVRLAAASAGDGSAFYHVDIPDDLMSTTIKKGQVKSISPIDIGILADIGIPVVNMNISKIQSVYGNSVNSTQNIIGEIQQTDELNNSFTNLIQTFSTAANLPKNVDLSSFLAQLDLNTQNSQSLQNASGTILSVNT